MLKRTHKFQSMVEYSLLLAALVLVFIYAASKVFKPQAKNIADTGGAIIDEARTQIEDHLE